MRRRGTARFLFCCPDSEDLLCRVTAGLDRLNLNIVDARVHRLSSNLVIMIFVILTANNEAAQQFRSRYRHQTAPAKSPYQRLGAPGAPRKSTQGIKTFPDRDHGPVLRIGGEGWAYRHGSCGSGPSRTAVTGCKGSAFLQNTPRQREGRHLWGTR